METANYKDPLTDDIEFYKSLLMQHASELRNVFIGSDVPITKKSLARDIKKFKGNQFYTYLRNFKYFKSKDELAWPNKDEEDLANAEMVITHKNIEQIVNHNSPSKQKTILPTQFKDILIRSSSVQQAFKLEDCPTETHTVFETDTQSKDHSNSRSSSLTNRMSKNSKHRKRNILSKHQTLDIMYFDKNYKSSKNPPLAKDKFDSKQKKVNAEYYLKDLTQKGANIKKIFSEVCPEKFLNNRQKNLISYDSPTKKAKNSNLQSKNQSSVVSQEELFEAQGIINIQDQEIKKKQMKFSQLSSERSDLKGLKNKKINSNTKSQMLPKISNMRNMNFTDLGTNQVFIKQSKTNLQKPQQQYRLLSDQLKFEASQPKEICPQQSQVTQDDDALGILYKFQQMHHYNLYNTKVKINNVNNNKVREVENIKYVDLKDKNRMIVVANIDKTLKKTIAMLQAELHTSNNYVPAMEKRSASQPDLGITTDENYEDLYDSAGRFKIKNIEKAHEFIKSIDTEIDCDKQQKTGKVHGLALPHSFNKSKRQYFETKIQPYQTLIANKDSMTDLASYQKILKNLKTDSQLQGEQHLKARDRLLVELEDRVQLQLKGQNMFEDIKQIDSMKKDNKYFIWQLKKIEKNPLYKIDYKRQQAIMDAQSMRANAHLQNKEMFELEKKQNVEKRDIYMSRAHDAKKRKLQVGYMKHKANNSQTAF